MNYEVKIMNYEEATHNSYFIIHNSSVASTTALEKVIQRLCALEICQPLAVVRFARSTHIRSRNGSAHNIVPEAPMCPKVACEVSLPLQCAPRAPFTSQPRPQSPVGKLGARAN